MKRAGRCTLHDDLAWLYEDGSVACMHQIIVESSSSGCQWEPMPEGWTRAEF